MIGGSPADGLVKVPAGMLAAAHRAAASELGSAAAADLLRQMGLESAPAFLEAFRAWLGRERPGFRDPAELPAQQFWSALGDFFESIGWGRLSQSRLHQGVVTLQSEDWLEAEEIRAEHPSCHFSTGVLAEILREVAGREVAAMEVECRAAGGSRCLFLLGSPPALEVLYGRMSRGAGLAEAVGALG
jgi:bacteriochlorophyll 4-vinyl reductase